MARTAEQIQEEITATSAAILRLLQDGQSWTRGARARSDAQLKELRDHRSQLEKELSRLTRGGITLRRAVPLG